MVYKREIMVRGGCGGDGCVSFRKEKHVPFGGPDGGDGGAGGNVIIASNPNLVDLGVLGRRKEFAAENGRRGGRFAEAGQERRRSSNFGAYGYSDLH